MEIKRELNKKQILCHNNIIQETFNPHSFQILNTQIDSEAGFIYWE